MATRAYILRSNPVRMSLKPSLLALSTGYLGQLLRAIYVAAVYVGQLSVWDAAVITAQFRSTKGKPALLIHPQDYRQIIPCVTLLWVGTPHDECLHIKRLSMHSIFTYSQSYSPRCMNLCIQVSIHAM